jgi:hypothetical protein
MKAMAELTKPVFARWVSEDKRFAFSSTDNGGVEITQEQWQALLDGETAGRCIAADKRGRPILIDPPPPSIELLSARGRQWRNGEIENIKWLLERHRDEVDLQRPTTLNASQSAELREYVQRLRDWPASEDFPSVERRPPKPEWLTSAKK